MKETIISLLHKQVEVFANEQLSHAANRLDSNEKAELQTVQSQIGRNNGLLKGLYESMITGDITAGDYTELKQSYESKLQVLVEQERQLRADLLRRDVSSLKQQRTAENVSKLFNAADLTADVLSELVEKITVFEDKRVKVHFKFTDETGEVRQ